MDGVKPLTDAQLAEMLDDPDGNYTHPGVEAAERIASMVAEIRMHRDAMAPAMLKATRLYTDETGALRKRVPELEALLKESLKLYESADCVGPTRQEQERIKEMQRMMGVEPQEPFPRVPDAHGEAAFRAGFDAAWEASGEGFNGEYTRPSYTLEAHQAAINAAWLAFSTLKSAPNPESVIQRAHDLVKEREVARLEGLRTKDGE